MYNIELGKTGLIVPTLAVGCMRINNRRRSGLSTLPLSRGLTFSTMRTFTAGESANRSLPKAMA